MTTLGRFRDVTARMDAVLVDRLGDRAIKPDGLALFGAFFSPFVGADVGGKSKSVRLGNAIVTDNVLAPTFTARVVDAVGIEKDTFLTIDLPVEQGGGRYKVSKREPDGAGMVNFILSLNNG